MKKSIKNSISKFLLSKKTLVNLDEKITNTINGGATGYMVCADGSAYCSTSACITSACVTTWNYTCGQPPSDRRYKKDIVEL